MNHIRLRLRGILTMAWQVDAHQRSGAYLTLIAAFVLTVAVTGSGMAAAQQTVYVGGSGRAPVEINLGVIETLDWNTVL